MAAGENLDLAAQVSQIFGGILGAAAALVFIPIKWQR